MFDKLFLHFEPPRQCRFVYIEGGSRASITHVLHAALGVGTSVTASVGGSGGCTRFCPDPSLSARGRRPLESIAEAIPLIIALKDPTFIPQNFSNKSVGRELSANKSLDQTHYGVS